jgi:hypothetical protein
MSAKKLNLQNVLLVLAIIAFAWSFFSYQNAKQEIAYLTDPEAKEEINQQEVQRIVEKVNRLIVLPEDEQPVVATITDAESLSTQQDFFLGASNGDKVVIYQSKAIIYSPSKDIIVNVGPVNIEGPAVINMEIRNGSAREGAALELAQELADDARYSILDPTNAARSDYDGYTLVNLKNRNVSALEEKYGVEAVTEMPAGEAASDAEVVLIIGN